MSSKKFKPTPNAMGVFMQRLFADAGFYDALEESIRNFLETGFIPSWDKFKTVTVRWVDAWLFIRLFGDTPEGGGSLENQTENMSIREAFVKQLRDIPHSSSAADDFVVMFRAMSVQVRIKVLSSNPGKWNMRIFIEHLPFPR